MSQIDPTATLASLVAEQPGRAPLFERPRLDYCCGGSTTLSDACAAAGFDVGTVLAALDAIDAAGGGGERLEGVDWHRASVEDLCAHIVAEHHAYLNRTLPRIQEQLVTVIAAHGPAHPELAELVAIFTRIRHELEPHLATEEHRLFPVCIAVERGGPSVDEELLREHEREHASVGAELARLRAQANDYEPGRALCATHRSLLTALADLERDLHQHIHEENNILFAHVRELGRTVG